MMKRLFVILICSVLLAGCVTAAQMDAWKESNKSYYAAISGKNSAKSCEINLPRGGALPEGFNLVCYQSNQMNVKAPEFPEPHGLYKLIGGLGGQVINVGGLIWGMDIISDNVGHNVTDSYNETTTTTTSTTTSNTNEGTFDSFNGDNITDDHTINNEPTPVTVP
jgi:hypothetical protein